MFPLLLRTLLMFTLFVSTLLICSLFFFSCWTVSFQKHCVFFLFPRPSCFIQSPFSLSFFISFCESPFSIFSPYCFVFFFLFFSVLLCRKMHHFSEKKNSLRISQNCFSEVLVVFCKNVKNCSFIIFDIIIFLERNSFWTSEKRFVFFYFCSEKNLVSFFWKMGKRPDLPFGNLWSFQKILVFFPRKHVVLNTKKIKIQKKSWTKKERR